MASLEADAGQPFAGVGGLLGDLFLAEVALLQKGGRLVEDAEGDAKSLLGAGEVLALLAQSAQLEMELSVHLRMILQPAPARRGGQDLDGLARTIQDAQLTSEQISGVEVVGIQFDGLAAGSQTVAGAIQGEVEAGQGNADRLTS